MNEILRVLVVDDSENDAEFMLRQLRHGGYNVQSARVDTAAAMEAMLDRECWDVIICDYRMPGFGGMEALALYKQKQLDLPFIVVSGYIGEDVAVGAMKAGAHDYIMKDKMARLVPAVARELREAVIRSARKESERALRESEERLRAANEALSESSHKLEQRVQERTFDLTVANAALQCQINERMRLERELLEIAEKERRRMGFDLHDDLSQKLMGVLFLVKALERKVAGKKMPRLAEARRIQALINQVINHTHDLAHDFSSLDSQGGDLARDLKALAANVRKLFQTSCRFTCRGKIPVLQQNVAAQLYKIAQEAASNAVKHGHTKLILISLVHQPGKLMLTIANDGVPFPEGKGESQRMGLRIMNSRASLIGASLEIGRKGDEGTLVICTLPLLDEAKVTQVDFTTPRPGGGDSETDPALAGASPRMPWSTARPALNLVQRNGGPPLIYDVGRSGLAEPGH
jgi:signal transduction histidine kinase